MEIELELKNYRCFTDESPARLVVRPGFTAFVGPNNSGKSAILRFFHDVRHLCSHLASRHPGNWQNLLNGTLSSDFASRVRLENPFSNQNERPMVVTISVSEFEPVETDATPVRGIRLTLDRNGETTGEITTDGQSFLGRGDFSVASQMLVCRGDSFDISALYRAFDRMRLMRYIPSSRYLSGPGESLFDIETGERLVEKWSQMQTGSDNNQFRISEDLTERIRNLLGFPSLSIQADHHKKFFWLGINGERYRLSELGDGSAQIITTVLNVASIKPPYLLIDEPEANLHPSLQIEYLDMLSESAEFGVMFATHSYGLARAVGQTIYAVERTGDTSRLKEIDEIKKPAKFLHAMSYGGFFETGIDKLLLVEGRNDMSVLRHWLRQYGLGAGARILSLGGGDLVNAHSEAELAEIKSVCPKSTFALIDSERTSEYGEPDKSRAGFKKSCDKLGITCHITRRRALENYFTDAAVKKAMGQKFQNLQPFEAPTDLAHFWGKRQNGRIARHMTKPDLEQTDLHQLFEAMQQQPQGA